MNLIQAIHDGWRKSGMPEDEIETCYNNMVRGSVIRGNLWGFEMDCEKKGIKPTYHRYKKYLEGEDRLTSDHIESYTRVANAEIDKRSKNRLLSWARKHGGSDQ